MTQFDSIPEAELPEWILRARQSVDWGFLFALLLAVVAAWPFIIESSLPAGNHIEHLLFRSADATDALRSGIVYLRWSPDLLNGYGAPLPSFSPPAVAQTTALLTVMLTDDLALSLRLIIIASYFIGGLSLYSWILRHFGGYAGIIATALWLFSPYIGVTLPHVTGDIETFTAFACVPLLLWAIDRQITQNHIADMLVIAGSVAWITTSQPALLIAIIPFTVIYVVVSHTTPDHPHENTRARALLSIVLGILITTFYWLPALLESSAVNWLPNPIQTPDVVLTLADIFQTGLSNSIDYTPGYWLMISALIGLLIQIRLMHWQRLTWLYFIMAVILLMIITSAIQATWLVGLLTLTFIVVTVSSIQQTPQKQRYWITLTFITITVAITPPINEQMPRIALDNTLILNGFNYQQSGYGMPGVPASELIPTSLSGLPTVHPQLERGYATGAINRMVIPETSANQSIIIENTPQQATYQIRFFEPLLVEYLTADYAGWEAWLDNLPLRTLTEPDGHLSFVIPAIADGRITVTLGTTPLRLFSWGIGWVSVSIMLGVVFWRLRHDDHSAFRYRKLIPSDQVRPLILGLGVLIAGLTLFPFEETFTPLTGESSPEYTSDSGLNIHTFALDQSPLMPHDVVSITWHAARALSTNYQYQLTTFTPKNNAETPITPLLTPAGLATARWPDGYTHRDTIPVEVPDGTFIILRLYQCETSSCNTRTPVRFFTDRDTEGTFSLWLAQG